MNRIDVLAEKLAFDKYLVLGLPFSEEEKDNYSIGLKNFFLHAHSEKSNNKEFEKLNSRKDQGSLLISTNQRLENLLARVVGRSQIVDLAKNIWGCKEIYYASTFSHYRMVDPGVVAQMNYQVLHVDHSFLKTKSLNVCIPATAYGREFSGIEFFVHHSNSSARPGDIQVIEPFVQLGQALIFPETTPHQRTVINKTKIRINTEFRIFPDYTQDPVSRFGLKKISADL